MLSIQTPSILGKQRVCSQDWTSQEQGHPTGKFGEGIWDRQCVCAFEGCFKTVDGRCEALCWFLGAIPAVLASSYIFLSSLDESLCYLEISTRWDGGEKKPSQILTGALGKAHCLSCDAESFLCIYYKRRNTALGTELCLKILQRSYRVENSREKTCSRSRDFLSKIKICIQNVKNNERKPEGQLK